MTQADFPVTAGPLAGLPGADFSRVPAGPYCTMLLADRGADVINPALIYASISGSAPQAGRTCPATISWCRRCRDS